MVILQSLNMFIGICLFMLIRQSGFCQSFNFLKRRYFTASEVLITVFPPDLKYYQVHHQMSNVSTSRQCDFWHWTWTETWQPQYFLYDGRAWVDGPRPSIRQACQMCAELSVKLRGPKIEHKQRMPGWRTGLADCGKQKSGEWTAHNSSPSTKLSDFSGVSLA